MDAKNHVNVTVTHLTTAPPSAIIEELADQGQQVKLSLQPGFVSKVLLEHRHAHLFTYCL